MTPHPSEGNVKMIRKFVILLLILAIPSAVLAQDTTTVEAKSEEIGDNLDLEAVASIFGEAEDLEDFEKRLNDPETQINNLDLNEDGEVDFLRVMETVKDNTHFIAIQAVIGEDQYQDVASIEVEKDSSGETSVQVVGDVYMYGPNYICEPVYVHPPVFFGIFWTPYYSPWYSPWYYGHHPHYYRPWSPYPSRRYRTNVSVNINVNNSYSYTSVRKSKTSVDIQKKNRRNDYEKKNPDQSFSKRNPGVENSRQLRRDTAPENRSKDEKSIDKGSDRKVKEDWKPSSERNEPGKDKVSPAPKTPKNNDPSLKGKPQTTPKSTPKAKPAPQAKPKTQGKKR